VHSLRVRHQPIFSFRLLTGCTLFLLITAFGFTVAAQNSPLFVAAAQGDVDSVDRLAQGQADPNVTGDIRVGDANGKAGR
jgi:hypothetical protein